jgi:RNA polymerase sigma-70 factor, ECF subfamily
MPTDDFTSWYERAYPRVMAAIRTQVADLESARDATDEAFARALERWPRVSQLDAPDLWTYRVAVNVARRSGRRSGRERGLWRRAANGDRDRAPAVDPDPELWAAVRSLPDRQRQAVLLRYLLDLPQDAIAAEMGVAPGTVAATLHQARRALAEVLEAPGRRATGSDPGSGAGTGTGVALTRGSEP